MMLKVTDDETGALVEVESKTLDTLDRSFETEHYLFRFAAGSPAQKEITAIAKEQERDYSSLRVLFGFDLPFKIEYLLTNSPDDNGKALSELFEGMEPYPTNGLCIGPNYVFAAYNDEVKCLGCHEVTHLFSYRLCMPKNQFLSEGLAMYSDGSFWGKSNREWVREFLNNGSYVSVRELASDEKFFSVPTEITYPIAGAFVGFLMERLGKERFFDSIYTSDEPMLGEINELLGEKAEEAFIQYVLN